MILKGNHLNIKYIHIYVIKNLSELNHLDFFVHILKIFWLFRSAYMNEGRLFFFGTGHKQSSLNIRNTLYKLKNQYLPSTVVFSIT